MDFFFIGNREADVAFVIEMKKLAGDVGSVLGLFKQRKFVGLAVEGKFVVAVSGEIIVSAA